jgi:Tfp pilus assembly protein PilP
MLRPGKICVLLLFATGAFAVAGWVIAQETVKTPSDKTREAVEKLNSAPSSIGGTLQGLRDAAKDKLRDTLGAKTKGEAKTEGKTERVDLKVPQRVTESPAVAPSAKPGGRDPFRPMTLRTKVNTRARDNLSPLERLDLSQLKVVGIVWDIKEPRAMVEDTAGLGYVVKVGTPIGSNDGKVKAIQRNQIVVEEFTDDVYGARKKTERSLSLAAE